MMRKKTTIVVVFVLALALLAGCGGGGAADSAEATGGGGAPADATEAAEAVSPPSVAGQGEGAGFDSPEAAATAYLEAFKAGDLDAMVACFAVESYVEGCDYEAQLDRIGAFMYTTALTYPIPTDSGLGQEINFEARRGQIISYARTHFMMVGAYNSEFWTVYQEAFLDAASVELEEGDAGKLAALYEEAMNGDAWKAIDKIEAQDPAALSPEHYESENNQKNMQALAAIYGCEELVSAPVYFEVDGEPYFFGPDAGLYDGKWYLVTPYGNICSLMDVANMTAGLVPTEA